MLLDVLRPTSDNKLQKDSRRLSEAANHPRIMLIPLISGSHLVETMHVPAQGGQKNRVGLTGSADVSQIYSIHKFIEHPRNRPRRVLYVFAMIWFGTWRNTSLYHVIHWNSTTRTRLDRPVAPTIINFAVIWRDPTVVSGRPRRANLLLLIFSYSILPPQFGRVKRRNFPPNPPQNYYLCPLPDR